MSNNIHKDVKINVFLTNVCEYHLIMGEYKISDFLSDKKFLIYKSPYSRDKLIFDLNNCFDLNDSINDIYSKKINYLIEQNIEYVTQENSEKEIIDFILSLNYFSKLQTQSIIYKLFLPKNYEISYDLEKNIYIQQSMSNYSYFYLFVLLTIYFFYNII